MRAKTLKEKLTLDTKWLHFWFDWCFNISYQSCGYFDNRPRISLGLIFFHLTIVLPFHNKGWENECVSPEWGIAYHNQTFWIYRGGKGNMNGGNKWWTINMPWQLTWIQTSALKKGGEWEVETKKDKKNFWDDKWKGVLWSETHPYTYVLKSGEVQNREATITVQEMEWRLRGFKWSKWPRKVRTYIDINFNDEVGERSGSWKGGTLGCSYDFKPGESPFQCLKRMEWERKFN